MHVNVIARYFFAGLLGLLVPTLHAEDTASEQFRQLLEDSWEFGLQDDPLFATHVGDERFDHKLPQVTLESYRARRDRKQQFLDRLKKIDRDQLSAENRINYDVFGHVLKDELAELRLEAHLIPITNRWGFHIAFAELPKDLTFDDASDVKNYIARLDAYRDYTREHIDLMREGIRRGHVLPAVVLRDYARTIEAHIVDDVTKSVFDKAWTKIPSTISAEARKLLIEDGRRAIQENVVPGYRDFLKFMKEEYLPATRGSIGASALPNGREFYRHRVRQFSTLEITPEQVHETGLAEVKRIRAEMQEVIKRTKFDGDFAAFVKHLRTDPKFYPESPEAMMKEVAFVLKKMDGELPRLFRRLPRMPYGIRKVPDYIAPLTSTAYYSQPAGDGSRAGFYYVNTYNLRSRPLFELEALSLHEAVPGHHLQLALQQEMEGLPAFRRYAHFTAFIEGWALYAERLGLEVGFYQDPYNDFGRLSYEMWRACRLVVDTGMHYFGWTRQRAIQFMLDNTSLTQHNIETEIDRYISWPGQALGYKIGELKIRDMRRQAEEQLGDQFDVREFHDVVLSNGSVPLPVLERIVTDYVADTKRQGDSQTRD